MPAVFWINIVQSRIRYKLIGIGVVLMSLIIILGTISMGYFLTIRQWVAMTKLTGPLHTTVLQASDSSQRLIDNLQGLIASCHLNSRASVAPESRSTASSLESTSTYAVLDSLYEMARKNQFLPLAYEIQAARDELYATHQQMSETCAQLEDLRQDYIGQEQMMLTNVQEFISQLDNLIRQFDGYVSAYRVPDIDGLQGDDARRMLSEVMTDTWPTLRGLYQLRDLADRLRDSLSRPQGELFLQQSVSAQQLMISMIRTAMGRTFTRLATDGQTDQAEILSTKIRAFNSGLSGPTGLTERLKQMQQVDQSLDQLNNRLQAAIDQLRAVLDGVTERATTVNTRAQTAMDRASQQAAVVLGFLTLFVSSSALLTLFLFGKGLSRRVELLTRYTSGLMHQEAMPMPVPEALLQSKDELGVLAQTFDSLMQNLFVARECLVEESQSQIQVQNQRMMVILENTPYGLCLCDGQGRILLSNRRFAAFYNLPDKLIQPGNLWDDIVQYVLRQGVRIENTLSDIQRIFDPSSSKALTQSVTLNDGRILIITTVNTPDGGSMLIHEDVTERLNQQAKISHMAHHDALTGLPNRVLFRENVIDAIDRNDSVQQMALLYLDLDHFKAVNDTLGHPIGDQLLIEAAKRLRKCIREHDLIARLGGDEFAVMLTDNPTREDIILVTTRIIQWLGRIYTLDGQSILVGVSIGISVTPQDSTDHDQLFRNADLALYRAKQEGRNTYCFFEPEMDALMQVRRELELDLRSAIKDGQMQLYYQPVVSSSTQEVAGFEALLRWFHPQRGSVSPAEFIPVAEASGQIGEIGAWVLEQACKDASGWPDHLWVAVNVSPVQFKHRNLIQDISKALQAAKLPPERLELEITEGVLLHNTETTLNTLQTIHSFGVHISMDDFGTGYSSLSYLRMFKFDKVKIDQSFICDLHQTHDAQAMIGAITSMCANLGIKTTAEGVETSEQLDILIQQKCSLLQGYLFGRPMPKTGLDEYFRKQLRMLQ